MTPRLMTGTASYARGILSEFVRLGSPVEPVVIVNKLMADQLREWFERTIVTHQLTAIPLRDTPTWRLALIAQALISPTTLTRQLPRDLDVMHYPLTLPLPRSTPPMVITLHDVQHHDQPQFFSRGQRVWRRHMYDAPAQAATLVITDSEHAKLRIIDRLGIPADRIEAIVLGIDHGLFNVTGPDDEKHVSTLDLPDSFILYPAGLWRHKNHRGLIDALALLEQSDVGLILTGPTFDLLDDIYAHARLRGVGDRVRHLGFVSPQQLAALYRRARALVFPSLYEGFGAPPLEAMACGCPVATSGEGSLGEACGSAALVFDARAPESIAGVVDMLLRDGELREELRERGLAWARHFTWRAAAERHVWAYQRALEMGSCA